MGTDQAGESTERPEGFETAVKTEGEPDKDVTCSTQKRERESAMGTGQAGESTERPEGFETAVKTEEEPDEDAEGTDRTKNASSSISSSTLD